MEEESKRNHGGGIREEDSWRRHRGEGIMEEKSRRRNNGGGIIEESWRRNHGEGESGRRIFGGGTQEAPRRHPGSTQEPPRRTPQAMTAVRENACLKLERMEYVGRGAAVDAERRVAAAGDGGTAARRAACNF